MRTRFPEVRLLVNERNEGFARACNRGAAAANAPFILLLNQRHGGAGHRRCSGFWRWGVANAEAGGRAARS